MRLHVVEGNLLNQKVDVIVNAWNRNIIPWWLLLPQGVSGAIKKEAGIKPFQELSKLGPIPLGSAVMTNPGRLQYRAIIHVAGINMFWRSSEDSIRGSVRSAISLANENGFKSIALPLIGSGTGGRSPEMVCALICEELSKCKFEGIVIVVKYSK